VSKNLVQVLQLNIQGFLIKMAKGRNLYLCGCLDYKNDDYSPLLRQNYHLFSTPRPNTRTGHA
jgi:hypothetical protein